MEYDEIGIFDYREKTEKPQVPSSVQSNSYLIFKRILVFLYYFFYRSFLLKVVANIFAFMPKNMHD